MVSGEDLKLNGIKLRKANQYTAVDVVSYSARAYISRLILFPNSSTTLPYIAQYWYFNSTSITQLSYRSRVSVNWSMQQYQDHTIQKAGSTRLANIKSVKQTRSQI